ncbi:hypothetical protein, partial [Yersinia enterocolitica]|uniref:hypothetical protein n=1 Tax=Yersinia enterocolitica TaxID=630 RepID=UPI003864F470
EIRNQKSEIRNQKSEIRNQKSEIRNQKFSIPALFNPALQALFPSTLIFLISGVNFPLGFTDDDM